MRAHSDDPPWFRRLAAVFEANTRRRRAIRQAFATPEGKAVLRYLAVFCHATSPTTTERQNGRRDVWLFLQQHIQMDEDELAVLAADLTAEQRHQLWKPGVTYVEDE